MSMMAQPHKEHDDDAGVVKPRLSSPQAHTAFHQKSGDEEDVVVANLSSIDVDLFVQVGGGSTCKNELKGRRGGMTCLH
jgi:hypothetical protein